MPDIIYEVTGISFDNLMKVASFIAIVYGMWCALQVPGLQREVYRLRAELEKNIEESKNALSDLVDEISDVRDDLRNAKETIGELSLALRIDDDDPILPIAA